jgi:phosphoribosylformimino-5-aminoimidazole carboxamide ribotide isomerase
METIREVLSEGISRVILGSVAVSDPELVRLACAEFGERIAVGIDARGEEVAVSGWEKPGRIEVQALALQMRDAGVKRIIFTDIGRDGMLTGVNIPATIRLARVGGFTVIASGGVKGLEDVVELKKHVSAGIDGLIIGKALYTGALELEDALRISREGVS